MFSQLYKRGGSKALKSIEIFGKSTRILRNTCGGGECGCGNGNKTILREFSYYKNTLKDEPTPTTLRSDVAERVEKLGKEFPETNISFSLDDVATEKDLYGPGAANGEIPSDIEQATGVERYELLGKLAGIDVFDQRPLDTSRKGTLNDPIIVDSVSELRQIGCTGSPGGSHVVEWMKLTKDQPSRCWECGSVYKLRVLETSIPSHHDHEHESHGSISEHGHGHVHDHAHAHAHAKAEHVH